MIQRDDQRDVALLQPAERLPERVHPLEFSATRFREEHTYYAPILFSLDHGWPEFHASTFRTWCVAARNGFVYLDTKLPGGASGGPILDSDGHVGAVVVSTRAYPMQLGNPATDSRNTTDGGQLSLPPEERWFFLLKGSMVSPADIEEVTPSPRHAQPETGKTRRKR
jgi:hypothetical protein